MDTTSHFEELKLTASQMPGEEAIAWLDDFIAANPNDSDAFTVRGIVHWALGHKGQAITDYLAALKIDPYNSRARQAIDSAHRILNFFNKDLYNP